MIRFCFAVCICFLLSRCAGENENFAADSGAMDSAKPNTVTVRKQKMVYLLTMDSTVAPLKKHWTQNSPANVNPKTFDVNDYFLPQHAFNKRGAQQIKAAGLETWEYVWCTNDTLQETIALELYTDQFRTRLFHFRNDDIAPDMLDRIGILTVTRHTGSSAPLAEKQKALPAFISQASRCSRTSFTSEKGFSLGDPSSKALAVYGKPDTIIYSDGIARWSWNFTGDVFYTSGTDLKGKPIAKDSYGHKVSMYFRDEKLIGMILWNDIP